MNVDTKYIWICMYDFRILYVSVHYKCNVKCYAMITFKCEHMDVSFCAMSSHTSSSWKWKYLARSAMDFSFSSRNDWLVHFTKLCIKWCVCSMLLMLICDVLELCCLLRKAKNMANISWCQRSHNYHHNHDDKSILACYLRTERLHE